MSRDVKDRKTTKKLKIKHYTENTVPNLTAVRVSLSHAGSIQSKRQKIINHFRRRIPWKASAL